MQNIYIPIRTRKTGVFSFTALKKDFIMTITSVLNSISIAFYFESKGQETHDVPPKMK